ncbi:MAG: hypothetical protein CMI56_01265 [Parcubacteria group bacterium]|nr:hypothetical protein [Parcubacteria group bacterium]
MSGMLLLNGKMLSMKYSMYLLIICGAIFIYGTYEAVRVYQLVHTSKKLVEESMPYTTDKRKDQKSMLVLGDSTAVGVGAVSKESVAGKIATALNASVENHAQSGARLRDVVRQFDTVQEERYDTILIQAGANDAIYGTSDMEIKENISIVLRKAKKLSTDVVFLTSGDIGEAPLWPVGISQYMTYRTNKVRDIVLTQTARNDVIFVDLYTSETPFKEDPVRYYASDFLHLSGEGYGVWADLVLEKIYEQWPEKYGKK